jgi:hypothetical protein
MIKQITYYKIYCPCGLTEPSYAYAGTNEFFRIGDCPVCDCGNVLKITAVQELVEFDDIEEFPND